MLKNVKSLRDVAMVLSLGAAGATGAAPTEPLPELNLTSYMGLWHQVALYPNRFQSQCVDSTTATYTLMDDGRVQVVNRCRTQDGWDEAAGVARPRKGVRQLAGNRVAPASLEVSFLPAWVRWLPVGWGDYDVLRLGPEGQWSIVSEPSHKFLWVLSRTPQLDATHWAAVEAELKSRGFDLSKLRRESPAAAP